MSGCEATEEVKGLIRALARDLVQAGRTNHEDIVDTIHEAISPIMPPEKSLWKSEVAGIIAEGEPGRLATKSELQSRMQQLKKDMKRYAKENDPDAEQKAYALQANKDAAAETERQFRIKERIAEVKDKLARGDLSTPERVVSNDSPAMAELRAELKQLNSQMATARGAKRGDYSVQQRIQKSIDEVNRRLAGGEPKARAEPAALSPDAQSLKDELVDLQKRLADSERKPPKTLSENRVTRITKQIAELQGKIARGDYSKEVRTRQPHDDVTFGLLQQRDKLAQKVDNEIRRIGYQSQSKSARAASMLIAFKRAMWFTSSHTLGKLSAMAMARTVLTPAERAVSSVMRLIPGLSRVYARAPVEGGGLNLRAEGAALKGQFSMQTVRDTVDHLKTGSDSLTRENGKTYPNDHPILAIPQHIHGAIKVNVVRNAYFRTVQTLGDFYRKQWASEGMTPAEIDARMESPITQAMIAAKSFAEGQRSISLQDNRVAAWWSGLLRKARKDGGGAAFLANVADFEVPVVKVPTNIADEVASFAGGAVKAAPLIIKAIREGSSKLTPDQADYVARNLNKNGLGAGAMLLAYFVGPAMFGSFYQQGDNKKKGLVKEGDVKTPLGTIPRYLMDHPLFTAMTIGSTLRRIVTDEHKGDQAGLMAAAKGVGNGIPFLNTIGQITSAVQSPKSLDVFAGKQAADLITPPDLRRYATEHDPSPTRKPQGFTDAIKLGFPGLREQVPTKNPKRRAGLSNH
jgi:hypothetical protein